VSKECGYLLLVPEGVLFRTDGDRPDGMMWAVIQAPSEKCLTQIILDSRHFPLCVIVSRQSTSECFGVRIPHAEVLRRGVIFRREETDIYFKEYQHDT
jgi:hypothetical protein